MSSSWVRFTSADSATRMPCTSGRPRTKRPGLRYGHGSRDADHLQRAQLLVGDSAVRPASPRQRPHRQPDLALARPHQHRLEDLSQHQRVVERVVRPHLVMPQCAASVSSRRLSVPSSSRRASSTVHITVSIGSSAVDQLGLGGQEGVVEADVVGHQRAAPQQLDQVADDVGEPRLALQHLGGQPVHMGGPRVDAGIEQAVDAALDVAVVAEGQRGDADDAGLPGPEAGRLDVDDGPACAGFGCRPAPECGSQFEDRTAARQSLVALARPSDRPRASGTLNCRGWSPLVDVSRLRPGAAARWASRVTGRGAGAMIGGLVAMTLDKSILRQLGRAGAPSS